MSELLDIVLTEAEFIEAADPLKLYYFGSPYSHSDQDIVSMRYRAVFGSTVRLIHAGFLIFSPIVYSHPLAQLGGLGSDWEYWERFDKVELEIRDALLVHMQDGWEQSRGLIAEIALARSLGYQVVGIIEEVSNDDAELVD